MNLQPKKQSKRLHSDLSIIIAIIVTICLMGMGVGYFYSQLPANNPQKNQANCEKAGGEWQKNKANCLLSYRAAGEACTDGGQCQSGICFPPTMNEEQMAILAEGTLSGIIGTCYPDGINDGCIKQVINGKVTMQSLCY